MIRNIFVDRENELRILEREWNRKGFSMIILYGRRRVGKTTLLKKFCSNKPYIYYMAIEASYDTLCKEFSETVSKVLKVPISGDIIDVIEAIPRLYKDRIAIVLDEFQYIVESDELFPSRLQRAIDSTLKNSRIKLILCGSAVSFFKRRLLGYKSPLFGRRESSLRVHPMKFIDIKEFFPRYSPTELSMIYGVVGGTPAYLAKLDPNKSPFENIRDVISPGSYLYDEAVNLLRQEVREPRTYFTILSSIAEGRTSMSEIASIANVDPRTIVKYVELLEELEVIRRVKPIGFRKPVRLEIRDNYFRFWFTYVYKLRSMLEYGYIDEALAYIRKTFNDYMSRVFENIVEELTLPMYATGVIKTKPIEVGKWWHKGLEIDLIVRDPGTSSTFIEVKWKALSLKEALKMVEALKEKSMKSGLTSPINYYMLIAREIKDGKSVNYANTMVVDFKDLMEKLLMLKHVASKS